MRDTNISNHGHYHPKMETSAAGQVTYHTIGTVIAAPQGAVLTAQDPPTGDRIIPRMAAHALPPPKTLTRPMLVNEQTHLMLHPISNYHPCKKYKDHVHNLVSVLIKWQNH